MSTKPQYVDDVVASVRTHVCSCTRYSKQNYVDDRGVLDLSHLEPGCAIVSERPILTDELIRQYVHDAARVVRVSGLTAGGYSKQRRDVTYYVEGEPAFSYSGQSHYSMPYPPHVLALVAMFRERIVEAHPASAVYTRLSHAIDVVYSNEFERGGSIGAHGDIGQPDWGLVIIFSLGQSRWLRVRHTASGEWTNVHMRANSLVAMCGARFQRAFTHQVDKLRMRDFVGTRLSLNVRYGLPLPALPAVKKRARQEEDE